MQCVSLPNQQTTNEKSFLKNKKVYSMANQYYFTLNNVPAEIKTQSL